MNLLDYVKQGGTVPCVVEDLGGVLGTAGDRGVIDAVAYLATCPATGTGVLCPGCVRVGAPCAANLASGSRPRGWPGVVFSCDMASWAGLTVLPNVPSAAVRASLAAAASAARASPRASPRAPATSAPLPVRAASGPRISGWTRCPGCGGRELRYLQGADWCPRCRLACWLIRAPIA